MIRSLNRNNENLKQQLRLIERQDRESARLPNAGRIQQQLRDQRRQIERSIDRAKNDIRTLERQRDELKRMMR